MQQGQTKLEEWLTVSDKQSQIKRKKIFSSSASSQQTSDPANPSDSKQATEGETVFTMDTDTEDHETLTADSESQDFLRALRQSQMWKDMEESLNQMTLEIQELRGENDTLRCRLMHVEGRVTRLENKAIVSEDKVIDLTARSMRDNLIIKNVPEVNQPARQSVSQSTSQSASQLDETEDMVLDKIMGIFRQKLKIPEDKISRIVIERAHRTGKRNSNHPRNIIVKLNSRGKSTVMAHIKNIPKQDPVKIVEQFPPEIHARRNKLWSQFIQAKEAGKQAHFKVDKLVIDKKIYNHSADRVTNINMDVTQRAMNMTTKHTSVTSVDRNHFQGHM